MMKRFTNFLTLIACLTFISFLFPKTAHAYLDPGTGSYILQLAIAGLLGASLAIKMFWSNIRVFFSNLFSKGQEPKDDNQ